MQTYTYRFCTTCGARRVTTNRHCAVCGGPVRLYPVAHTYERATRAELPDNVVPFAGWRGLAAARADRTTRAA